MRVAEIAEVSDRVAAVSSRNAKISLLADALRSAAPDEKGIATSYLMGELLQGRIGIGPAAVRSALQSQPSSESSLTLRQAHDVFDRIAAANGQGSARERGNLLGELFTRATHDEQRFLARLIHGELRHGALEGVVTEAVARASDTPAGEVRRALQLAGSLPVVALAAFNGGSTALRAFGVQLFRPLQPMLAQPADDVDDGMRRIARPALDYKLDGARVQVHRQGDIVRVFTRGLNDVTAAAPEIVNAVMRMPVNEIILDGESIVMEENGRPAAFQKTMNRFGRVTELDTLQRELPLSSFFFDLLYVDGESLIDRTAEERFNAMRDVVPPDAIVPRLITADPAEAARFMTSAKRAGHEGLVMKDLESTYDAGRRGASWLKVKQADTLDLVVLAAEWGNGRRQGWLSNLHLGARNPADNSFVMLGKTFKGLTDEMLVWQTRELLAREIGRESNIVHVRPELVVEIAYEGVQTSPRYPGGVALRFARVKRYRSDKSATGADTIDRIRAIHRGQA